MGFCAILAFYVVGLWDLYLSFDPFPATYLLNPGGLHDWLKAVSYTAIPVKIVDFVLGTSISILCIAAGIQGLRNPIKSVRLLVTGFYLSIFLSFVRVLSKVIVCAAFFAVAPEFPPEGGGEYVLNWMFFVEVVVLNTCLITPFVIVYVLSLLYIHRSKELNSFLSKNSPTLA